MTDEEMQGYIDQSMEYDDEELLETIDAAEADLRNANNGKRLIPIDGTNHRTD